MCTCEEIVLSILNQSSQLIHEFIDRNVIVQFWIKRKLTNSFLEEIVSQNSTTKSSYLMYCILEMRITIQLCSFHLESVYLNIKVRWHLAEII